MKIDNIPFNKFISLTDTEDYEMAFKYGKFEAKDIFNIGDFTNQPFGFVKDVQDLVCDGMGWESFFEELAKVTRKHQRQLSKYGIFDLYQEMLYFKKQIESINEIESALAGTVSNDELNAGIDRFDKYKAFLQYDSLCNGNILLIEQVKKLPYSICLAKLMLESDRANYKNDLNNIRNKAVS